MSKKIEQPKPQIETKLSDRILSDAELDRVSGGSLTSSFSNVIKTLGEAVSTAARKA
jgi:hypothetical protein